VAKATSGIRGVLFDLDGTLVDTYQLILETFKVVTRRRLGRVIPDEVLMCKVGQPLAIQFLDWFPPEEVESCVAEYREINAALHDRYIRCFPGGRELMDALHAKGLKVGVVTSKGAVAATRALRDFDLFDPLDTIVTSEDTTRFKPLPDPVLLGCRKLGLEPAECMYVGDAPFDIMSANAAGAVSVAALWGMFPADVLRAERPAYEAESLPAILGLLG